MGLQLWIAAIFATLSSAILPPMDGMPGRFYRADRARIGARLFEAHCAACHGVELQGEPGKGPPLVGPSIRARRWKLGLLFSYVSRQMPADARGSLTRRDYLDVTSFLLLKNGHPAGSDALTPALLQHAPDRL